MNFIILTMIGFGFVRPVQINVDQISSLLEQDNETCLVYDGSTRWHVEESCELVKKKIKESKHE